MTIVKEESPWVTLREGDTGFQLQGPLSVANRAGIEISKSCPDRIQQNLMAAIFNGWIKPVAHVPKNDPTLMWDILKDG